MKIMKKLPVAFPLLSITCMNQRTEYLHVDDTKGRLAYWLPAVWMIAVAVVFWFQFEGPGVKYLLNHSETMRRMFDGLSVFFGSEAR